MQTTRWVNGPETLASPERRRPFWDAQDLWDAVCGREIGFQMALGGAIQRTNSCGTAERNQRCSLWFWLSGASGR